MALFQALPAKVGIMAMPVMRAKEGTISHHILLQKQNSGSHEIQITFNIKQSQKCSCFENPPHHDLHCLKLNVDILDHMRGCHWVAQRRTLRGIALLT